MKFMILFLIAMLPAASVAQTPTAAAPGLPRVAIPKTTAVLVIETPRQGVTFQQVMDVIPAEIRATVNLYLEGKIREWYSRGDGRGVIFLVDAKTEDEARDIMGDAATFQGTVNGYQVHSRRAADADEGIDRPGSAAAVTALAMGMLRESNP
jgi:hypothetical protein